jgi:hypothetical protein
MQKVGALVVPAPKARRRPPEPSKWGIFADATAASDQTVVLNEGRLRDRVRRADSQPVDDGGDVDTGRAASVTGWRCRVDRRAQTDGAHGEGLGFSRQGDELGGRPLSLAVRPEPIGALFPLTSVPRGSTLPLSSSV